MLSEMNSGIRYSNGICGGYYAHLQITYYCANG